MMRVHVEGKGLSLVIIVADAIDYEIVRLSIALAKKRIKKIQMTTLNKEFSVLLDGVEIPANGYAQASQIAAAKLKPGESCFVIIQIKKLIES